jgi:predicted ATPase/class 3 adenylate cyclase
MRAEVVIRTPDQRLRVFVSSTMGEAGELAAERRAVVRAISALRLTPVLFELGARPYPPQDLYRAYLAQSDIFVGLYWQRYGRVGPGMEVSGLEEELQLARAEGLPRLLYVKTPAPGREPRLAALLDRMKQEASDSYRYFRTPGELGRLVRDDLATLLSERFAASSTAIAPGSVPPQRSPRMALPTGTVTFLFTDIEGSTRLLQGLGDGYGSVRDAYAAILRQAIDEGGGVEVSTEGDSFFAAFASPARAVQAAVAAQRALATHQWPMEDPLRVRMGLHTGEGILGGDNYVGLDVHRAARIAQAGHGGQVLISAATRDLVERRLGGGFGLRRLGEFRLRDLAEPELIYQLTHADLPADFPPLATIAERSGNLPLPVSSFIGRERELGQIAAAVGEARVVTLTGPGGVGKTRLALQAAAQVAPRFADGAWLCELAPIRDQAGVDDAVAAVFSVTARAGQSTRETLVEFLRSRQLLLVLDNCEHLLERAAALAGNLARSCERLVILANSREALRIEGERLILVPSLGLPGANADLAAITQAEAVRLFAERAAAVKPDFAVTTGNAAAVAAVVRRLDGMPLAIELAAARSPAMTPAELARRLERSFAVLTGGPRDAAQRHQTLRATIDWSFGLLSGPEQVLLARLAVFAGGATLEAAEAVCGGEGIDTGAVLELLAALVARSLVVAEEHGHQTRYRLLETIRQYGEERLEGAGETERWRARHARYYASLLRQIRDHAHDPNPEVFWAVRLSADQDNLLAAWSWAIGTGNADTAFSILAGFAPVEVWNSYPLLLPGNAALELPGAAEHPGYPLALAVSALFASNRADVAGAEELCRRAAEANARHATPDWRVEEAICAARSNIANTTGAFTDAARLAEQAAGHARTGGDIADASFHLGLAAANHILAGDAPAAVPLAREALTLARQTGAPALIATSLLAVGATVAGTDPGQARARLHESRELSTALGYQSTFNMVWATTIAFLLGDQAATLELGRAAIRGLQWGGDRLRMGIVLYFIAGALATSRPEAAAIIQGAIETYVAQSPIVAPLISSTLTKALGDERVRELRGRGADMDWSQAVAYTLTQTTQARSEPGSGAQP